MPRVFYMRARKHYPRDGIRSGQMYYKWTLRPGGPGGVGRIYRSLEAPRPWQLVSSSWLRRNYLLVENIEQMESLAERDDIVEDVRELAREARDSWERMPPSLQRGSPQGEMLDERARSAQKWADDLAAATTLEEARTIVYPGA